MPAAWSLGCDLVHAGGGERAGLQIENGRVFILLLGERGRGGDGAGQRQLVGVGLARTHHREGHRGSRLAFQQQPDDGQRQLARGLVADGLDDVAVREVLLVGGRTGQHADHHGVTKALGDGDADLRHACRRTLLVNLVLGRSQVAGVGVERLQQAVQRAGGHIVDVGVGHVVGLDLLEHLAKNVHLAVGAILLAAGMNAKQAKLAEEKAEAEGGKDRHGKNEDKSLEESRHTHHRGGP